MKFEWDERKNRSNVQKHGVSFETAVGIFGGPVFTRKDERFDYGEVRQNSIGRIGMALILLVTHTDRNGRTRVISARPAKRSERERYEEALREGTERRGTGGAAG